MKYYQHETQSELWRYEIVSTLVYIHEIYIRVLVAFSNVVVSYGAVSACTFQFNEKVKAFSS